MVLWSQTSCLRPSFSALELTLNRRWAFRFVSLVASFPNITIWLLYMELVQKLVGLQMNRRLNTGAEPVSRTSVLKFVALLSIHALFAHCVVDSFLVISVFIRFGLVVCHILLLSYLIA